MLNRRLFKLFLFKLYKGIFYKERVAADKKYYKQMLAGSNPFPKKLTKEEKKKHKDSLYDFTAFKNYYDNFEVEQDYFVSDIKYYSEILPRLSPITSTAPGKQFATIFSDKNFLDILYCDLKFPSVIVRSMNGVLQDKNYNVITFDKAVDLLSNYDEAIFKISTGTGNGYGIKLVSKVSFEDRLKSFGKNFLVQEKVEQHEFLSSYNSTSVNIIRVTTLFWNDHFYYMGSVFRVGVFGSFCDHTKFNGKYPVEVELLENGTLGRAIIFDENRFVPDIFGKKIEGKIPNFNKLVELAMENHKKYPLFGIIGWDFTLDKYGEPLCIEANFRSPDIFPHQCFQGPIFMQKSVDGRPLLDEIMETPIDYQHMRIL